MHRSIAWGVIAIAVIVLAPFVGVFGAPALAARAAAGTPAAAAPDDEVIVITSTGQLRVDDPSTPTGIKPVSWNSGSEVGFTHVAAGDFNGDGDAELVAARGSVLRVFDPVVQTGRAPVDFTVDLGDQRNVRLLNTGDFDADGKDEFAVVFYIPGSGSQAGLKIFDGGTNATVNEWHLRNSTEYGAMFQDMGVGDFNADGADDLALIRNAGGQRLVLALNVRQGLTTIAENGNYCCDWFAIAGGNLSTSAPGDELALLRSSEAAKTANLILFRVVSGQFTDLLSDPPNWNFYPEFVSLSNGDLNGDGDDEVVMLRDPTRATTSLLMVNPTGVSMNPFEQATGYGSAAFRIVRTGDTDGDGLDEIVILRADRYRIYTEPNIDSRATETTGTFYTTGNVSNLPFMAVANVDGAGQPLGPILGVSPASLSFSLSCGDTSPLKPLTITNTGTAASIAWQAQPIEDQTAAGGPWLLIDKTSGTTTGTVNVSVRTNILTGNYTGKVRITTTDANVQNKTVDVPVTYAAQCPGFVVSPTTLDFNVAWGNLGSAAVSLSAPGAVGWTASVLEGSGWLTLSAASGTTPGMLYVTVNAAAAGVGASHGTVKITAADSSLPNYQQYVSVNLTVPDPGFVASPSEITIYQKSDFASVVTHQITVERPKQPTNWTASAAPLSAAEGLAEKLASGEAVVTADGIVIDGVPVAAPAWLVFQPTSGVTPSTMTVNVKPGTAPGIYRAVINVVANGDPTLTNPVQSVFVTAHVVTNLYSIFLPLTIK